VKRATFINGLAGLVAATKVTAFWLGAMLSDFSFFLFSFSFFFFLEEWWDFSSDEGKDFLPLCLRCMMLGLSGLLVFLDLRMKMVVG
jgi:hypothetical protein